MSVGVANLSAATTTFRVGDVVRADITLETTRTIQFNAVQVAVDFDAAELVPVTDAAGRVAIAPTAQNENRDAVAFHVASGTFGANATILRNTFSVVGTGSASGQARLDAGVELPAGGGTSVPVTLTQGAPQVIASMFLRVRNNPTEGGTNLSISLRDSGADGGRFGLVAMVDTDDGGFNVLGPVVGATLGVSRTTVGARLVVAPPAAGTVRRIGDVVPVRLALDATTTVRNARSIRATIGYSPTVAGLVSATSGANGAPPPFVASGTFTPDLAGGALGTSPTNRSVHAVDASTGTVHVDLDGGPLVILADATDVTVATLYFRALNRGALEMTLGSVQIGDASLDLSAPQSTVGFPVAVSPVTVSTIMDVRGSVGVGVAAVGSPLAQADGSPAPLSFASATTPTFTVTDGRYLDVEVRALAGPSDAQAVASVAIDVDLPPGVTLAPGDNHLIAPGLVADGPSPTDPAVTAMTSGASTTFTVRARVAAGMPAMQVASPVARVRLAIATATFTSTTELLPLAIGTNTSLTQAGSRFASNLHDAAPAGTDGSLDFLPMVTRQKPASFAVPLRLQGRSAADPPVRFAQPVEAFLAVPGAIVPTTRLATTTPPAAVSGTASGTMRYAATSASTPGATGGANATVALPDLDPGTYDLFVKGRSSLGARVARVTLLAGANNGALPGPVALLEGDADRSDAINIGDFAVLATTYATAAATDPAVDTADFNQSGYVDAFDFSLLARNYAVRGPVTLATINPDTALPTHLAIAAASSTTFSISIPSNEVLTRARISVTADTRLGLSCPQAAPAGTTCTPDGASRVTLSVVPVGGASGAAPIPVGAFALGPTSAGSANLTAVLLEATGTDAAGQPTTYRSPSVTATIVVNPDILYALQLVERPATEAMAAGIDATVTFDASATVKVTGGIVAVSYDATRLAIAVPDGWAAPTGTTCTTADGVATFAISAPAGLPTGADFRPVVRLVAKGDAPAGSASIQVRVLELIDGATDPTFLARSLTAAPAAPGDDTRAFSIQVGGGAPSATVTATRTRTAAVRVRAARPVTGIWLSGPDGPVAPGAIVPIELRLAAGTPVDAAQVVLRAGDGYRVVDAKGLPADHDSVISEAGASPLPVVLRRAVDAVSGLVELAFGRQIGQGSSGATGEGRLGTILVRVPEAQGTGSGPALTIVPAGTGAFASVVVGPDGAPVGTSGASVWLEVDASATGVKVIDLDAPGTPVDPIIGPPAPSGAIEAGTGVARMPVTPSLTASGPRPSSLAPSASSPPASGPRASLPASRLITEDRARGTITVSVPGRAAVELRTGLTATEPDAYCPIARHRTYIRLQDVGIAGATFGVEPGGVLAWVTPEQAGCVNWAAIETGGLAFTKETIMQFQLARAAPGALLWVLDGTRQGDLYEVDASGTARYVTAEAFATQRDHFTETWANVIPVSSAQVDGLAVRGAMSR
jgi:hypothetical protein